MQPNNEQLALLRLNNYTERRGSTSTILYYTDTKGGNAIFWSKQLNKFSTQRTDILPITKALNSLWNQTKNN